MTIDVKSPYLAASVSVGGTFTGFVAKAAPILQMVSLTVAIIAGVFSSLLAYTRWRNERKKR